jgi:hypothetical protein
VPDPPVVPEHPASEDPTAETPKVENFAARPDATDADATSRAARWATRRGRARRVSLVGLAVVVIAGGAVGAVAAVSGSDGSSSSGPGRLAAAHAPTSATKRAATTRHATTTTTVRPHLHQPAASRLPLAPSGGLGWGSSGPVVAAVQRRLKQLHFDPGVIDGQYGQDTNYAVTTADKLLGLPRDGVITPAVELGLDHFKYTAAMPNAEENRVEINLDTEVLTVFQNDQPILLTTTSTGSGEHFCGGTDGCQYAITPAGHFHFQYLHPGWDNGKLGRMWNPYYFDGGIAVHGLPSVPPYPASHGCARIPMSIANYFPSLVTQGESIYVVGTPMQAGSLYVGPAPVTTPTTTPAPPTTQPKKHPKPPKGTHSTTSVPHPTTTVHVTKPSAASTAAP